MDRKLILENYNQVETLLEAIETLLEENYSEENLEELEKEAIYLVETPVNNWTKEDFDFYQKGEDYYSFAVKEWVDLKKIEHQLRIWNKEYWASRQKDGKLLPRKIEEE